MAGEDSQEQVFELQIGDYLDLKTGVLGEVMACQCYERLGYRILGRNQFNRKGKILGELDLVAQKDQELVFVEVKTRKGKFALESALSSVHAHKQRRFWLAVRSFLSAHPELSELSVRGDVCVVIVDDLDKSRVSVRIYKDAIRL